MFCIYVGNCRVLFIPMYVHAYCILRIYLKHRLPNTFAEHDEFHIGHDREQVPQARHMKWSGNMRKSPLNLM